MLCYRLCCWPHNWLLIEHFGRLSSEVHRKSLKTGTFCLKRFLGDDIDKGFNRHNFSNELKLPWITFNSFFFTDVMVVVCVKIKHHTENPESKIKHSWIIVIQNKPKNSANNQDRLIPLKCRHVCLLRGSFRLACSCRTRHWTSVTVGEA